MTEYASPRDIFADRSAGDFYAFASQAVDELIVGKDVPGAFGVDQLLDPMADRFGEWASPSAADAMAEVKKYFQLENAPRGGDVFV